MASKNLNSMSREELIEFIRELHQPTGMTNTAAIGYASMALEQMNMNDDVITEVAKRMLQLMDEIPSEKAESYCKL